MQSKGKLRHRLETGPSPVFVDGTGRRRKWFTAFVVGGGVLLVTFVVTVVAGFFGVGPRPLPGFPELGLDIDTPAQTPAPAGTLERVTTSPGHGQTTAPSTALPTPTAGSTPTRHNGRPSSAPTHTGKPK